MAGTIGFAGCFEVYISPEKYVNGTVIKESGTIVDRQKIIERSEGALFGNDSVRFGNPTYAIQFKADDGKIYSFGVYSYEPDRLEALNLAIEEGTKIRIKQADFNRRIYGTVGRILCGKIEVLGKE